MLQLEPRGLKMVFGSQTLWLYYKRCNDEETRTVELFAVTSPNDISAKMILR